MKKINLISVRAKALTKKQILLICKLKNSFWTRTVPDQLKWFKKNVKKMDINNMLIIDGNVVGYTLLRRRSAYIENRRISYFYFDTFLVRSDLRKKGLG